MTATESAPLHRVEVRLQLMRHPELGAMAVIVIAWTTIVALSLLSMLGGFAAPNISGMASMPGMTMMGSTGPHAGVLAAGDWLGGWIPMCIAMMGPAALAGVRHTGLNSLWWRRGRAVAEFSAAYLGVWAAFESLP